MTARFRVSITTTIEIAIDDAIVALCGDAAWVRDFYGLGTPEEIAEHLAYNVGLRYRSVSRLDGFADRADADVVARVTDVEYETERLAP